MAKKKQNYASIVLKFGTKLKNFYAYTKILHLHVLLVLERSNHEWSFLPDEFYLHYFRTFFPVFNKIMSYTNTCATTIIGTWVRCPNVCRTESFSMCRSLFGIESVKNKNNQNAKVNQLIPNVIVTWRFEIIWYTTKNVHLTTRTTNFLNKIRFPFVCLRINFYHSSQN